MKKIPKSLFASVILILILFFQVSTQQAIHDYNKVIELNPIDALAYCTRGFAYSILGNEEQALNDLKIAARLGDKVAEYYLREKGISW
jgi:regulator of sirC expression with transglutaminase-like and TPR domain